MSMQEIVENYMGSSKTPSSSEEATVEISATNKPKGKLNDTLEIMY